VVLCSTYPASHQNKLPTNYRFYALNKHLTPTLIHHRYGLPGYLNDQKEGYNTKQPIEEIIVTVDI